MNDNLIFLKLADVKMPEMKEVKGKEYVQFGESNDYPDYLLLMADKSAKHNAILSGKAKYIFGSGLQSQSNDPQLLNFINSCNRANEGADEIAVKMIADTELFGGYYLHIIPNAMGQICEIYHVDFSCIRTNRDRTKFWYCEDWTDSKLNKNPRKFEKFSPGSNEESIFAYREYRAGKKVYPFPKYYPALNWIESDYQVSKHTLSNAKTGFSASKMVSFMNGEPEDEDKKRAIEKRLNQKFTGSEGSKLVITFNNDISKKPVIDDLGASDLTKENFGNIDDLICQNIFAAHEITSPMLFGISANNKFSAGEGNLLKYSYDIFKNLYSNNKQKQIESVLNYFCGLMGMKADLKLVDIDPIGIPFTDQTLVQIAPRSWILEKLGIDPTKYPGEGPAIQPSGTGVNPSTSTHPNPADNIGVEHTTVNENIKNLTPKQHQQIMRVVRNYNKGVMTREQAALMLKNGYGFSDSDVDTFLGNDQFDKDFTEQEVAEMFSEVGESKESFRIVKSKKARFTEDEFSGQEFFDAAEESAVGGGGRKIGEKILSQVSIKYSYEPLPGLQAIIPTTRYFCKRLIELDRLYSRADINKISQQVGYSVWERRGGFWNNNGDLEKHCRHQWQSHIVIKK